MSKNDIDNYWFTYDIQCSFFFIREATKDNANLAMIKMDIMCLTFAYNDMQTLCSTFSFEEHSWSSCSVALIHAFNTLKAEITLSNVTTTRTDSRMECWQMRVRKTWTKDQYFNHIDAKLQYTKSLQINHADLPI